MNKVLIVVDLLNAFCADMPKTGSLAKSIITGEFYARPIIKNVMGLVAMARDKGIPIIWLCDAHSKYDLEFKRFPPHAIKDTWDAGIIDELNPSLAEASSLELVIPKTRYSGFYGTDLEYQLSRLAPNQVEVCGVCTSICVMDTVGGLANRDYDTVIHKDCVADFDPAAHEAALARMKGLYGATII